MIDNDFRRVESEEDEVKAIPEKNRPMFYEYNDTEFAGMVPPANRHDSLSGLLTVDCGATSKT
jgi:hypothetical protein